VNYRPNIYVWFLGLLVFWSLVSRFLQTNSPKVQQSMPGDSVSSSVF